MFGFLTFGTTLTVLDLACKAKIESQDKTTFPRDMKGSKGMIKLYQNHNPGFSFGVLTGSRAVKLVPLCITSALAGAWTYLMGVRGKAAEKMALTLVLAGGMSNLIDRLKRGYVVDFFSIQWKALKKVVFNIGDIYIFLGCGILLLTQAIDAVKEMIAERKA